ncbi:Bifunctional uridylyltransferase/uridylyl-removing enzyme [Rubripirellula amarantea]|uniref:Bifunctional uridylyltransferase/uridylyl-removing enzyme n=1 Tax=Rubripirellula amarantea TaxID=2527999 RepID=A0A5C5WR30_9BACT|nr:[protein-PII] uridylyltransferase [Rubripirellula amarantea]TWT53276.1 Bifunctional uridylyltransferase/uridylyl-removing enzyme [Rubripirellula amarantea]
MRPFVLRCRHLLEEGREKAYALHRQGTLGMQVSTQLADLYDEVVLEVWNEAVAEHGDDDRLSGVSLIAHGGFGRRDLAPYSDADLMLLSMRDSEGLATKLAGNLTRDLSDIGIDPGLSIRTPSEACSLSWSDAVVFSSLAESRFLAGSLQLYKKFFDHYRHGSIRRSRRLVKNIVAARQEEREKWGETNYLLRPNVKRSRGALRDIQLIRWIGFARFGETDLDRLLKLGALPEDDFRLLRNAYGFMLRLRHELHFRSGKSQDVLDRATQMEIAAEWGYEGTEGVLPVEQFMQDYFEKTREVRYSAAYFVEDARSQPLLSRIVERVFSRKIDDKILMGPTSIWVRNDSLESFASNLPDVLRLMSFANQHRRRIQHKTWLAIRLAMRDREPSQPDSESIEAFLSLLSRPGRLASLLRRLHELRLIEQIIPEFARMRGLLQFNAYHKYTVDAHSFLAVEAATDLENSEGGMGRRYRRIEDKRLLHLALLIHDIGKGYEEDHCIVGAEIARRTAERLNLDSSTAETLEWLVLKHLAVNVVAFRHDLSDPQIVLSFAAEVGSIRRLELLVVHTYADLKAVGPGVATDWKVNLIEDLYRRTRRYFDSGDLPGSPDDPEVERNRTRIRESIFELGKKNASSSEETEAAENLLSRLPFSLITRGDPESLAEEIILVAKQKLSGESGTICTAKYDPAINATRYTVIRQEDSLSIGTFSRATGALSTSGLSILRAQIETVDDYAWDHFWATDPNAMKPLVPNDPATAPVFDQRRADQVCERLRSLIDSPDLPLPPHRKTWKAADIAEPESVNLLPKKVVFDNDTIERYTIISIFAYDEVGLLSRIAATLTKLRLVLSFAKIDTHLDQVADVFYVSESDGSRITNSDRQSEVRQALLDVIG